MKTDIKRLEELLLIIRKQNEKVNTVGNWIYIGNITVYIEEKDIKNSPEKSYFSIAYDNMEMVHSYCSRLQLEIKEDNIPSRKDINSWFKEIKEELLK